MGGLKRTKTWLEQRELGQKGLFILYEEIQAYNGPKLGQEQNEVGTSQDSAKIHHDNLPNT